MSNYLILPIEIEGTPRCIGEVVLSEYYVSGTNHANVTDYEFVNLLHLDAFDLAGEGEVSFAVSCSDEFSINFEVTDYGTYPTDFTFYAYIYVNEVLVDTLDLSDDSLGSISYLYTEPLTDSPCGSVITILGSASRTVDDGDLDCLLTITF